MEFKVENICGFLIRSKLMTPDEMQAMRQRWLAEAKDAAAVPAFLKWLVAKNYLTEYQASLLSRGHVDDFFLGEYRILERIGRGRMAGVYKAAHGSGQVVAIKVLPPSSAKNAQTLARFQREARLGVKLKHPHVVRAFQVGESKGVHYLVMEYLEGGTLEEVLERRKRLPPAEAVRLVHQALLGLQHIHEMGMVHRDLKPANLMLLPVPTPGPNETTLKSSIKILDIGLAREFFDENAPNDVAQRTELTGEGVLLGTPDYLAPEQARDPRSIDIRADIYSLGCTLYHLLTGQPPFPDKNILNQMIRHATETPKPLQDFVPTLPEGLSQIVSWMMAKQPDKRYPTPARAAQALDAFLLVTSESAKVAEETPALKKYLTWLEMTDPPADVEKKTPPPLAKPAPPLEKGGPGAVAAAPKPPSGQNIPVPSPKPPSGQNIPVLPKPQSGQSIPVASAKPAPPVRRKKRTGVKMPEPIPTAAPAGPPAAPAPNPFDLSAPAPGAPPVSPDQIDVELVDLPAPTPRRSAGFGLRDLLMIAVGIVLMLLGYGACTVVSLVRQWISGE